MNGVINKVAVYTTVYPGAAPYLRDWYRSVQTQSDQEFELWIGLDGLKPGDAAALLGIGSPVTWVCSETGDTPARIRQRALEQIAQACDAVVLVDSDDVLRESRVAAARAALQTSDLAGCALELVDRTGCQLGMTFGLPPGMRAEHIFPRHNVFGFSNSAYRSDLLRHCLPIPPAAVLVDWFLVTRAWLIGARLAFDPVVRMAYRQHGANMARVRFPVDDEQVMSDTELVREHFRHVLGAKPRDYLPERLAQVERAFSSVERFREMVVHRPDQLKRYVAALNSLDQCQVWWSTVAHPALERMWETPNAITHDYC